MIGGCIKPRLHHKSIIYTWCNSSCLYRNLGLKFPILECSFEIPCLGIFCWNCPYTNIQLKFHGKLKCVLGVKERECYQVVTVRVEPCAKSRCVVIWKLHENKKCSLWVGFDIVVKRNARVYWPNFGHQYSWWLKSEKSWIACLWLWWMFT